MTGLSPFEYVRERRLTLAATAIIRGCDVADTAYRFNFSAQDSFTRSFKRKFGIPPVRFRKNGGTYENYTPKLKLSSKGDSMILRYSGRMEDYSGSVRLRRLFSDDVKQIIGNVALNPLKASDMDARLLTELKEAAILKEDNGLVKLDCTVFLEPDIELAIEAAEPLGEELAHSFESAMKASEKLPAIVKHFIVDTVVMSTNMTLYLVDEGVAFDWRNIAGKYAKCEIHFDEICDAFEKAGPYNPNWNGSFGERFAFIAISTDDMYSYTSMLYAASIQTDLDAVESFMHKIQDYLTDSFALLVLGEIESDCLKEAAEAARLFKDGKPAAVVILEKDADSYLEAAINAKATAKAFIKENGHRLTDFLKCTHLYRIHGVSPNKSATHFLRYVNRAAIKKLYANGFFTDSLFLFVSLTSSGIDSSTRSSPPGLRWFRNLVKAINASILS